MEKTFDYIIIGAGSAGCVLANRLSADPSKSVLLVEAGGADTKLEIHIPAGYAKLHYSNVDWGSYWTEPQKYVLDRQIYLPRGRVLGGCSSTNAMAYVRGNKEDYNDWAKLGNTGWSYEDVLPYFKKSEKNEDFNDAYHSTEGVLNVGFAKRFKTPFAEAFVESCVKAGFERNPDYNGATQAGAGLFQFSIKNGKRESAVTAFINPIKTRKNLTILLNTFTNRILIENDRATGIEIADKNGNSSSVKARKEVILSAGAFASPQLLMLSGIGDAEKLKQHGIDCKKHLVGVGQNLQDHIFYPVSALATVQEGQNHHLKAHNQVIDLLNYLVNKKGILTTSPLEAVAFGSSSLSQDRVDYQFHFASLHIGNDYKANLYKIDTFPHTDGFTILPTLLRPKSRGFVDLRSANPRVMPIIQPNFLEAEDDRRVLIEAGRKAIEVIEGTPFAALRKETICPPDRLSDEAILLHIQKIMETVYHPVGTCKMGNDEAAVVDAALRVRGIEGLRVVDASIMPNIVSGNTNAPVYMIAEKAADMIMGEK